MNLPARVSKRVLRRGAVAAAVIGLAACTVMVGSAAHLTLTRAALAARSVAVEWDAYAVGPGERSLELILQRGVCGHLRASAVEGRDSVVVEVDEEQGTGACPALATVALYTVTLARPLAGRAIEGPNRIDLHSAAQAFRWSHGTVPRLLGFSAHDAFHALELASLRGYTRFVHGSAGRARVVSQQPAPGARAPSGRLVRLTVAGG